MSTPIACFVMSGGVGSRLWPLSREDNPKQFHDLAGDGSMLARQIVELLGVVLARQRPQTRADAAAHHETGYRRG